MKKITMYKYKINEWKYTVLFVCQVYDARNIMHVQMYACVALDRDVGGDAVRSSLNMYCIYKITTYL